MAARTLLSTANPEAYKTMLALDEQVSRAAQAVGIPKLTVDLLKIRVSQINGCAFCLRMHTRDALDGGESLDRLAVLSAWRETQYFSDAERAALAIAEEITLIADRPAVDTDAVTSEQAAALRWAAIVINGFNRVAISSHYLVKP
jgi:AhpD family alkylhydroperoxidase